MLKFNCCYILKLQILLIHYNMKPNPSYYYSCEKSQYPKCASNKVKASTRERKTFASNPIRSGSQLGIHINNLLTIRIIGVLPLTFFCRYSHVLFVQLLSLVCSWLSCHIHCPSSQQSGCHTPQYCHIVSLPIWFGLVSISHNVTLQRNRNSQDAFGHLMQLCKYTQEIQFK